MEGIPFPQDKDADIEPLVRKLEVTEQELRESWNVANELCNESVVLRTVIFLNIRACEGMAKDAIEYKPETFYLVGETENNKYYAMCAQDGMGEFIQIVCCAPSESPEDSDRYFEGDQESVTFSDCPDVGAYKDYINSLEEYFSVPAE